MLAKGGHPVFERLMDTRFRGYDKPVNIYVTLY